MTVRTLSIAAALFVLSYSAQIAAADQKQTFQCSDGTVTPAAIFKDIQEEAKAINKEFCAALSVPASESLALRNRLGEFAAQVYQVANARFGRTQLDKMEEQLDYFTGELRAGELHPRSLPTFVLSPSLTPGAPRAYFFNGNTERAGSLTPAVDSSCNVEFSKSCDAVLEDFAHAIFPYQVNYNAFKVDRTIAQLDALSKQWDAFFADARPQTTLDLILTTKLERHHLRSRHLVGPPKRQWFALHPEIMLEYVDGAPDGERFKAGLAVEWAGVNWWEDSWIGIPFGFSLTSLYSDRAEISDVGHGVTLHFKNALSLGWVSRSGDDGYFLSLDLLTLFEDKQDRVKKFSDQMEKL